MIKIKEGDKYGRLTFVKFVKNESPRKVLACCECGNTTEVWLSNLTSGHTKSCGCLARESSKNNATHGMSSSKEYKAWTGLLYRVYNENAKYFESYSKLEGAVQESWQHSFSEFLSHIGRQPSDTSIKWSVGRIDNTIGYVEGNVRWEDAFQQNRNRGKSKANTSDATGVTWREQENRPNNRAIATWYDLEGKQKCKSFSDKHIGKAAAIELAKEYRDQVIAGLVEDGAEYGEHHGA